MTALAGWCDVEDSADGIQFCTSILDAQRKYGSRPGRLRSLGGAAFGIQLFSTLPEDAFDQQPLSNNDLLLVADLRIDNRGELAAALGLAVPEAAIQADSDLFFMAWRRWGKDCLSRVVGEFAIAVYSASDRTLSLLRDPLGRRPLHYARCEDTIAFSSMATGILALPQFRRGLDLRGMAAGFLEIAQHEAQTSFQGIQRVLPGQILTFSPDGQRQENFWNPSFEPLRLRRAEDYVEAYRDVLEKAVRPRLRRAAGAIATHLSSGLDSSAVAATAAEVKTPAERLLAYTSAPRVGFSSPSPRNRFADESGGAALTARRHGMTHEVVRTQSSLLNTIEHLPRLYETPFWNIINLPWLWGINDDARSQDASILLTGEGGNLTLNAGGLGILGDLVSQGRWNQWWSEARLASKRRDIRWRGILFSSFEPKLPRAVAFTLARLFLGAGKLEDQSFINPQWLRDPVLKPELDSWSPVSGDTYRTRLRMLQGLDVATYGKGSLAGWGLDLRSPLLDRRIVEFSLQLPREQLFRNGVSRPLAVEALSDRLPPEVLGATDRGYQAADWFEHIDKSEILAMVEEIGTNSTVAEMINLPRIRSTVAQWPTKGFHKFSVYHPLGGELPMALATGHFILHAEKWLAGESA